MNKPIDSLFAQKLNDLIEAHKMLERSLIESLEERFHLEENLMAVNRDIELLKEKKQKIMTEIKKLSQLG